MAENKKSFILYADLLQTVSKLPDNKAGKLFKTILEYVNDKNPTVDDLLIQVAFEPIKQQLKRDLIEWEKQKQDRSDAGKKGMKKRWGNKDITKVTKHNGVIPAITKITDNVTVTVNDTVTDNVKEERVHSAHPLEGSNLFRKPTIPDIDSVRRVFLNNGGTEEMAQKFFETHTATEWYYRNSPIKNFAALVPGYIKSWQKNNGTDQNNQQEKTAYSYL